MISVKHNNIYLFYFILTTCFSQPTVIRPSLQNSEKGAMQCTTVLKHAHTYKPILQYILKTNRYVLPWYILITNYTILKKGIHP